MNDLKDKWDAKYIQNKQVPAAAAVLTENSFLLPEHGKALDLACGLGANALFLAESGLQVQAWDISPVAVAALTQKAMSNALNIKAKQCNIVADLLPKNAFDVIVISRFLDRTLCNAIMTALKNDGLLFYQTFTQNKLAAQGPNNPDFLLAQNELLNLFKPLTLVYYRENSRIGNLSHGERNEARFIGQKTE